MTIRAIVLAAGKGTRMKSARPKVLHELCGRSMLWFVLDALREAGVDERTVVASRELASELKAHGAGAATVVQEPQLGTGHAVRVALDALAPGDGTVLIAYADMPLVDAALFKRLLGAKTEPENGPVPALALVTARMPLPSNFGRVIRAGGGVARIVEERDCTDEERAVDEMNAGIYAFEEAALRAAIARVGNENAQREYYLTDTIEMLARDGKRVTAVRADDHRIALGVNDRAELARARAALNARLCERHMAAGVTIIDPATTYLEPELEIGPDTVIYPNTTIGRLSSIGGGCEIGPNSRLSNARLGAGAIVKESVVIDASLGDRVRVGPFAHLRGNSELGDDVHIGNYVELKKTKMGKGAKANHLTYLGDSTVGERANIGAGTITCNYDGRKKNRTEIGEEAFIGSNSSLVAPITIGARALTGAGSVVIRDVADDERVAGNPAKPLPKK